MIFSDRYHWIPLVMAALLLSACQPATVPQAPSSPSATSTPSPAPTPAALPPIVHETSGRPQLYLNEAQKNLPRLKLFVGTAQIDAELATTLTQIATGMMHRVEDDVKENEGMLFVFPNPRPVSFYMRNTHIPLSGAYIDSEGTILEIHPMTPHNEAPIPSKSSNIQYVLEMKQGWFEKNGITEGMLLVTERGPFPATFFGR